MPRCLMAKKWKAYPWPDRAGDQPTHKETEPPDEDEEEIDVVGDANETRGWAPVPAPSGWGPSSPTAGATAPSPPPNQNGATTIDSTGRVAVLYSDHVEQPVHYAAYLPHSYHPAQPVLVSSPTWHEKRYQVLSSLENKSDRIIVIGPSSDKSEESHAKEVTASKLGKKSMAMCYTSTGAALPLPPKKKDIYRPYSLDDRPTVVKPKPRTLEESSQTKESGVVTRPYEQESIGLTIGRMVEIRETQLPECEPQAAADNSEYLDHEATKADYEEGYRGAAELTYHRDDLYSYRYNEGYARPAEDISAAHAILDLSASTSLLPASVQDSDHTLADDVSDRAYKASTPTNKTVAYTYEAFFVSDGRSKKKPLGPVVSEVPPPEITEGKTKYTCTECGKQYATSSNLSRHKQTHRSLDSQSAKKCLTCGKAYVSMPALAMHLLTHKLSHGCGVCGKLFSRPWLLQGHLRSHTGEKPYGCAHCGKAFADRSNLRAHMQTHSIDKNYVCVRCNKSFALKSYLNKHLESACFKDASLKEGSDSSQSPSTPGLDHSPLTPPQSPSPILSYSL